MRYTIYDNGSPINIIEADLGFVNQYCAEHGYTHDSGEEYSLSVSETTPTVEARLASLEAKNKLLKEKVSAQADQQDFYEDCIAEMAAVVYA